MHKHGLKKSQKKSYLEHWENMNIIYNGIIVIFLGMTIDVPYPYS